jgi:cytidylate kinase
MPRPKREDIREGDSPARAVAYMERGLYARLKRVLRRQGKSFTEWVKQMAKRELGE